MTSTQKQIKRSSKFNYLVQEDNKEKLSKYDKLNFSPKIYKRSYEQTIKQTSVEKEKQNQSENVSKCIKSNAKGYSGSVYLEKNSNQKQGLISFGKNRNTEKSSIRQQREENYHLFKNVANTKQQTEKHESVNRIRNKSFGSIGLKKPLFEPKDSINEGLLQFSPYQQEVKLPHQAAKLTRSRIEFDPYILGTENHGENLLIYELQQQQLIVRKQLKEYEYQNELLRQRIYSLEKQNHSLKQLDEQHLFELQEKQLYFQKKLQSLSLDIREIQEQNSIWKLENQQLLSEINSQKILISELQEELHLLANKNQELQVLLNSKDHTIVELKTRIQVMQIDQLNFIETDKNKRRKSLDLSTQARKITLQQKRLNQDFLRGSRDKQQNFRQHQMQFSKTSNIGKLMNKTYDQTESRSRFKDFSNHNSVQQSHVEPHKNIAIEKYANFIESTRSMYLKVTGHESRDLKELWKWLKMITHGYQSFVTVYGMKDSIMAVLQDFQNRLNSQTPQDELSFMEKQCYKLIKKLANAIIKQQ